MAIPSWIVDVGTVSLSGFVSLLVARYTVDKRIDEERERDVEQWYIEAGVQAELAEDDWANQILSEGTTKESSENVLRNRASEMEEHAAKGSFFTVDEEVISSLKQLAASYRHAALLIEQESANGAELKEIEDEMWIEVDTIRKYVPVQTKYGNKD